MGKQFSIVAVEELTLQRDLEAYLTMFACLRGPLPESVGFRRHMLSNDIEIPATWRTFASFDLGSTRPWAWLAFAESDGTDFQYKNGRVGRSLQGDLFLIGEVYVGTARRTREIMPSRKSPRASRTTKFSAAGVSKTCIIRRSGTICFAAILPTMLLAKK